MREIFTHELQLHFHAVVFLIDVHGDGVFTVGVGDGTGAPELVAVDFTLRATHIDVLEGNGQPVIVRGEARNGVGFSGRWGAEHREGEQHRQGFVHAG